jgi:hypothetical protein
MTPAEFTETLRSFLRKEPFVPFPVELVHGESFTVDRPDAVSLGGGAAGFLADNGEIYFFDWKNTRILGSPSGTPG